MNEEQMRTEVTKAYPGAKWARQVQKMYPNQLQAVYFRLKQAGKI